MCQPKLQVTVLGYTSKVKGVSKRSGDWARATRGHSSPAQRSVLIELAHWYKDSKKTAWRNVNALAESCGVSERTVRRCLANLEEVGYITRLNNGNQYQHTYYSLNMESEPDTLTASKPKVNRTSCQVNRTLTTSEVDINDTALKERPLSTFKVPLSNVAAKPLLEKNFTPDWVEPLTGLEGFKAVRSQKRYQSIVAACKTANVSPEVVVKEFATYWDQGKIRHGWINPVIALERTINIQISKVNQGQTFRANGATRAEAPTDRSIYAKGKF